VTGRRRPPAHRGRSRDGAGTFGVGAGLDGGYHASIGAIQRAVEQLLTEGWEIAGYARCRSGARSLFGTAIATWSVLDPAMT
jgi:hypothetical protein